jgi:hypothetical protein
MDSVVISVRVKKETKAKLEGEGIDVQESIKEFLLQRASQIELREKIKKLESIISKRVKASKRGFGVESVREDRYAAH